MAQVFGRPSSPKKPPARILRAELVVIDDIGLLPVATDAAQGLYRVVDAALTQALAGNGVTD
ncbi:hypothetical protein [Pseudarthrobacter siccitolerans]